MTKIKICGLSRAEDIESVNRELPDYAGFVFAQSRRKITISQAVKLRRLLRPEIESVGVYVNASLARILEAVRYKTIDRIQLHGDESAADILRLKNETPLPVIKAIRVKSVEDILAAQQLPCDYLLLDTYTEGQYGGTGEAFDWSVIPPLHKPYFLAGGLNAGNIGKACSTGAYCLDVSSAAETGGYKDPEKIAELVRRVREAGRTSHADVK